MSSRYPLFYAFGGDHKFLSTEEAVASTADERIQSIWPFVVKQVKVFWKSLKPRERVNFDPEDTLIELWVRLRDKDAGWNPETGKYITYAGVVIKCELCSIRDKARTVESPRNSHGRIKEYEAEEAAGTISDRRLKTANDIRRTSTGIQAILPSAGSDRDKTGFAEDADPADFMADTERHSAMKDAVRSSLRTLDLLEAHVIGQAGGLFGNAPKSVFDIAWESGRDLDEVRRARTRAHQKISKHLLAIKHPVAECGES